MTPFARLAVPLILTLTLVTVPVLAHGGGEHVAPEQHDIDTRFAIGGFGQAELDFEAGEGETITWAFRASDPINMDIHQHGTNGTVEFVDHNGASDESGAFEVPRAGLYSIYLVRPESTEVSVRLQVSGLFAIIGTSGFEITDDEESPAGPVLVTMVGALALVAAVRGRRRG